MYHTIEFTRDRVIDLEVSPNHRMEKLLVRRGTRLSTQLWPHVVQTASGPVETADLYLADGTTTRSVPYADFCFVA
jgi:hypothetical protein